MSHQSSDHTAANQGNPTATRQSRRGTDAHAGLVNFPAERGRFTIGGGMGTFIKLVVVDDREYDDSEWNICCGADVVELRTGSLVAEDQVPAPRLVLGDDVNEHIKLVEAHNQAAKQWEDRHFPNHSDFSMDATERELSRSYLASLVIGISGRCWYDPQADEHWACTKDDLTPQGQALYALLQQTYPGCELRLLTFVDT